MKSILPLFIGLCAAFPGIVAAQNQVAVDLNLGGQTRRIVIDLNEEKAPKTAANFKKLAQSGFYDGMAVHRAIPNYIVQMGDPYTRDIEKKDLWGTGGPDYTIPAEIGLPVERGSVAMARLPDSQNPNRASNGSQFFIALDRLENLDGQYTVFGRVVRGIEHVDAIAEMTVDTNDVPVSRVEIVSTGNPAQPKGQADSALLKPVANAGETIKGAGESVVGAIPFVGKDKKAEKQPAAPSSEEEMVSADDPRQPPSSDLLEDEISAPAEPEPASEVRDKKRDGGFLPKPRLPFAGRKDREAEEEPVAETEENTSPAEEPAAQVEQTEEGRERVSLPAPEKKEKKKGFLGRLIERIW